jgi:hypothetical protein
MSVKTLLPRRRAAAILLFPVLSIMFLVGWLMYATGKPKPKAAATRQTLPKSRQNNLEMGIITQVQEETITNQ